MCEIAISVNSQEDESEIEISGTAADFAGLPGQLTELATGTFSLKHKPNPNPYYSVSMRQLSLDLVDQSNGVLTAQINGPEFKVSGDAQAFQKLADFLESLSQISPGGHFHLDWFADEYLLAPATSMMSFIFSVEK